MNVLTLSLLERLKVLIPEEGSWFSTLRTWYKNIKFTRRLIEELRSSEETALLSLRIGDALVTTVAEWEGRFVHWVIPAEYFMRGENTARVALAAEAQGPLYLDAATACPDQQRANAWLDLSIPEPRPLHDLQLSNAAEARHQADCWAVFPTGFLDFKLQLPAVGPVHFVFRLPEGQSLPWPKSKAERRQKLLEDVLERVKAKVQKKLAVMEQQLREWRQSGVDTGSLEGELGDLRAYEELHRRQIEPAIRGAISTTMEYVIQQTGIPDDLIRKVLPSRVLPAVPTAPPPAPAMKPVPVGRPVPSAPASSIFGKLLFLTAILSTGGIGYEVWRSNETQVLAWFMPSVKIDSLEDGQLVPAGREFQVAVTPTSPWLGSLNNTELKVTATGAVEGGAADPRRFAGDEAPTSQIFTFRSKPNAGQEESITLTAQLFKDGSPTGRPDTVTVKTGGDAMDLAFLITPKDLKPGIDAQVTITVVNAKPDSKVAFTVIGNPDPDNFKGRGVLPVGTVGVLPDIQNVIKDVQKHGAVIWHVGNEKLPFQGRDGEIRFTVPAGRSAGVVDHIEATIEGTKITRKARYSF